MAQLPARKIKLTAPVQRDSYACVRAGGPLGIRHRKELKLTKSQASLVDMHITRLASDCQSNCQSRQLMLQLLNMAMLTCICVFMG